MARLAVLSVLSAARRLVLLFHFSDYTYGVRPFYLLDDLQAGELKDRLMSCAGQVPRQSDFVIGHRGAPLQFPKHTKESYIAAARQSAGMLECDVTFTKDKALVCRHAQNDLHTTTNILATPLAEKCSTPFTPAKYNEQSFSYDDILFWLKMRGSMVSRQFS
nr:glycerophosphodiester phosphodiesterase family protein [Rappaport israeli]